MPVYRTAFLIARQTRFTPWFSQSSGIRRSLALSPPSTSRPYEFLGRFTSLFHRPKQTIGESMELQQAQRQHMSSHPGPGAVEVAPVRDKQALYVAPRQELVSDRVKRIKNPAWWTHTNGHQ
ncbi:hypothetical protein AZE42_05411 [Rhizopogon vesiculosus]|uniref:Uncharacterized protein n=1 Tax=Rhizopogon vesiculosus TaxID=180088 RepID=A0A1J8QP23_9AGAM|nr:hypothetical protein AZE42_05411 [Rhizopogon vesiculosus]